MEYGWFAILLLVSGFFSGSETALFSIGKVAQARLQKSENSIERIVAKLLKEPRDLLVGVLLGNELTNVALAIIGARITSNWLVDYSLTQQAMLSAAVVIPLLLVFGEVTPKTLAAKRPEMVASIVARPIRLFLGFTAPLIFLLRRITELFVQPRDGSPEASDSAGPTIDESEFRTLIDVGTQEGVLEVQEQELIRNVLDFGDLVVGDVMQPWSRVFSLEERMPVEDAINLVSGEPHSRIPIWRGDDRNVLGVLLAKDLLLIRWGLRPPRSLRHLRRDPLFTLAQRPVAQLLEEFRARRTHMAIVVDEIGRAIGLCTMEDLLEELFGPITDAHPGLEDPDERDIP